MVPRYLVPPTVYLFRQIVGALVAYHTLKQGPGGSLQFIVLQVTCRPQAVCTAGNLDRHDLQFIHGGAVIRHHRCHFNHTAGLQLYALN